MLVSPNLVPANTSIKVQPSDLSFSANRYEIKNERGELVRCGTIADPSREFSLSVGGMADGNYWIEMGGQKERFTVM